MADWLPRLRTWLIGGLGLFIVACAATAGVVVVWYYLPPLIATKPPEPERIAEAWNASIARLGIEPLFPPEEDVQVGDIFIVVTPPLSTPTLLGRALKIAHLQMRAEIENEYAGLSLFPDTAPSPAVEGAPWPQNPAKDESVFEPAHMRKLLPIVAFPGFTIEHSHEGGLALGAAGQQAGLGGSSERAESIQIPFAETYGVTAPVAWVALDDFCKEHKAVCTDLGARRVMMRVFRPDDVCAVRQQQVGNHDARATYALPIEIQLVNRVYLARSIEQEHRIQGATAANARLALQVQSALETVKGQIAAAAPAQPSTGPNPAVDSQAANARRQALDEERTRLEKILQELAQAPAGSSVQIASGDNNRIALKQTFLRPLTIGYRSVKFSPEPTENARERCK